MKRRKLLIRLVLYTMGMLILALGLTLNAQTHLGVAPVTSLPYTISIILDWNYGNAVFALYLIFVAAQLILSPKGRRVLILLQIPISLLFTRLMNGFDLLLDMQIASMAMDLLFLFVAILLIGIGAALTLSTKLVPNPVDGMVSALAEYFNQKVGWTKNIFDFSNAFIAFILGCIVGTPFLGVGLGTVFCVFGVGRVIALFNRYAKPWVQTQAGVSDKMPLSSQETPASLDAQRAETAAPEEG